MPDWVVKILSDRGIDGAIEFILLTTVIALVTYIRSMQARADKIYGYRLQERDTLNKALTDSAKVLSDMLKVTEERNEITEEQAKLIANQAQAFELLKVTVLAQYDSIKDHNATASAAVTTMADSIRALTSIVMENRTLALGYVGDIRKSLDDMSRRFDEAIKTANQAHIVELRNLLGDATVTRRRKT